MSLPGRWAMALIRCYQQTGGGRRWFAVECNFEPSCSEYTRQAVERDGFRRGLRLGWARLRRCNQPDLTVKRFDPLPESEQRRA